MIIEADINSVRGTFWTVSESVLPPRIFAGDKQISASQSHAGDDQSSEPMRALSWQPLCFDHCSPLLSSNRAHTNMSVQNLDKAMARLSVNENVNPYAAVKTAAKVLFAGFHG